MRNNPFASKTYQEIWLKHFNNGQKAKSFDFIQGLDFVDSENSADFVNVGKNFTNGMLYSIKDGEEDFKGKTFVVYDVPTFLKVEAISENSRLKCHKVRQYKGLYVDISKYKEPADVLSDKFKSSKSRYNFRSSIKKLEKKHNISQKVFYGDISKSEYEILINAFKRILEERFDTISTHNTVLPMWDFYQEVLYPLILDKQVALNVMYDDEQPIALSFSFVYDDVFVVALRTFDMRYYREGLGNIEIFKLIEWCIENNVSKLDFSKGESNYKERWCDVDYVYEHHILFDSKSLKAKWKANALAKKFKFKQYLRDKKVNVMLTKGIYKLKKLIPGKSS